MLCDFTTGYSARELSSRPGTRDGSRPGTRDGAGGGPGGSGHNAAEDGNTADDPRRRRWWLTDAEWEEQARIAHAAGGPPSTEIQVFAWG